MKWKIICVFLSNLRWQKFSLQEIKYANDWLNPDIKTQGYVYQWPHMKQVLAWRFQVVLSSWIMHAVLQLIWVWSGTNILSFPLKDMEGLHPTVVCFCLLFVLVEGYNTGPPVDTMQEICNTMLPNHGPSPQTSTDNVTITLGNDCYKEGHTVPG